MVKPSDIHPGNKVLCGPTAAFYHCATSGRVRCGLAPVQGNPLRACAETTEQLSAFNLEYPAFGPAPKHLLVPSKSLCRRNVYIQCHYSSASYGQGSFMKIGTGLYVCSPELCLIQCAEKLTLAQVAELGANLCARFYIHPITGELQRRNEPITTPLRIREYAKAASNLHGARKVARAAELISAGSESPMETACQLLLGLPKSRGGYGMPGFACNLEIDPGRSRSIVEQERFRVDFCWPNSKVVLEYDGKDAHADAHRDKRRANALEALGWTVFYATRREVFDMQSFDRLVRQIAKRINHRIQMPSRWEERCGILRQEIDLTPGREMPSWYLFRKASYGPPTNCENASGHGMHPDMGCA